MVDRYDVAAVRHFKTAEILERGGRLEDAGYHYGLAGETAVKAALTKCGVSIGRDLRKHFDGDGEKSLSEAVKRSVAITSLISTGRLGGALAKDLRTNQLKDRFRNWSIFIRYANDDYPVTIERLGIWRADAAKLVVEGVL